MSEAQEAIDPVVKQLTLPLYNAWDRKADWRLVPEHMRHGVRLWVEHGIEGGDFLMSVVENDLRRACWHADAINRVRLHDIVTFFWNYTPADCWGSPEAVRRWRTAEGWQGIHARDTKGV